MEAPEIDDSYRTEVYAQPHSKSWLRAPDLCSPPESAHVLNNLIPLVGLAKRTV